MLANKQLFGPSRPSFVPPPDTICENNSHWEGNTLIIPSGKIHKRGLATSNTGKEIEGWLQEALRENPDLKLSPMYSTPEMEEYIDMLREEVALKEERAEGQEQKVIG